MADIEQRPLRAFPGMTAHPDGQHRVGDQLYACPECPLNNAQPGCLCCCGVGRVSEQRLDEWERYLQLEATGRLTHLIIPPPGVVIPR